MNEWMLLMGRCGVTIRSPTKLLLPTDAHYTRARHGWLQKRGEKLNKSFKKRLFRATGDSVEYYESLHGDPKGSIDMKGAQRSVASMKALPCRRGEICRGGRATSVRHQDGIAQLGAKRCLTTSFLLPVSLIRVCIVADD